MLLDKMTSSEFNLDIITEIDLIRDKELIDLTTNNRILTDNGIVLDE